MPNSTLLIVLILIITYHTSQIYSVRTLKYHEIMILALNRSRTRICPPNYRVQETFVWYYHEKIKSKWDLHPKVGL